MPSTFTTRNRLNKQATGENTNTWGALLNTGALDLIDFLSDGVTTISAAGSTTLTTANGTTDQARARILNLTATTAATITIPSLEKLYIVRNAASNADHVITNGSSSVTVYAGEIIAVMTNGTTVWRGSQRNMDGARLQNLATPTAAADAATKGYADALAFNAVNLPAQGASSVRKVVRSDGATASWQWPLVDWAIQTSNYNAAAGDRIFADTTGGAFTITLPATPTAADEIFIADGGVTPSSSGWAGNNLTVARNGNTLGGVAENMTCRARGGFFRLTYLSGNWKVTG
jgi:hypothetical protein